MWVLLHVLATAVRKMSGVGGCLNGRDDLRKFRYGVRRSFFVPCSGQPRLAHGTEQVALFWLVKSIWKLHQRTEFGTLDSTGVVLSNKTWTEGSICFGDIWMAVVDWIGFDLIWFDSIWLDWIGFDLIGFDPIRSDPSSGGTVRLIVAGVTARCRRQEEEDDDDGEEDHNSCNNSQGYYMNYPPIQDKASVYRRKQ